MLAISERMRKDVRDVLIICGVILSVFVLVIGSIYVYSGVSPPFSTINSGSMQHSSNESHIGTIDTGDMVIVQSADKHGITTYVDGAKSGYSMFGEYGDVIIYRTETKNIIHRAMLELELVNKYDNKQVWHIPSLIGYEKWSIKQYGNEKKYDEEVWNPSSGELTVEQGMEFTLLDVGYEYVEVSIEIWNLGIAQDIGYSGYLTKGDNAQTNRNFDQCSLKMMMNKLVQDEDIKSVAVFEIPWIGSLKLYMNNTNVGQIPSNSITSLIMFFVVVIILIIVLNIVVNKNLRNKILGLIGNIRDVKKSDEEDVKVERHSKRRDKD